ncbi:unnamed protein product [Jaminaea pallidilutea]
MTVSHRKSKVAAKADEQSAPQPGVQYHCDVCEADITLTVRVRCAGGCKEFDLCGSCFCSGAEAKQHKAWHDYRIVEQHSYPIFVEDWGADEELLLIDGCQTYGLGNWADIADHIGNRSKEEVEAHYVAVFVEGRDGTEQGDRRAEQKLQSELSKPRASRQLPVIGPNMTFDAHIPADEFQQSKRRRIADLRAQQASMPIGAAKSGQPPKPLVSAPTSHHELSGFMPGRLEFETEHEQDAEVLTKDMEFGKVYSFGGELLPSEEQALGGKAVEGRSRMDASARGGASNRGTGAGTSSKGLGGRKAGEDDEEDKDAEDETKADGADGDAEGNGEAASGADHEEHDAAEDDDAEMKDADETAADETSNTVAPQTATPQDDTSQQRAPAAPSSTEAPAEPAERPPADWDEDPQDLDLKLTILEMYNERLERRTERKAAILERGLVEVRRRQAAEKRRPKEERDLLNRVRHFAQLQTPQDFEEFLDGLCYQEALRRLALRLQEYRKVGISTLAEASKYEVEKEERLRKAQQLAENVDYAAVGTSSSTSGFKRGASQIRRVGGRDSETPFGFGDDGEDAGGAASTSSTSLALPNAGSSSAARAGPSSSTGAAASSNSKKGEKDGPPKSPRKPPRPLDLSSHPSLHLLTRPEQILCSTQRIQPSAYLIMKKEMLTEYIRRNGRMSRRESRTLFKMDVNKVGKVYDMLEEQGFLSAAKSVGWVGGQDGAGAPPGWKEKPMLLQDGGGVNGANGSVSGGGAPSTAQAKGSSSAQTIGPRTNGHHSVPSPMRSTPTEGGRTVNGTSGSGSNDDHRQQHSYRPTATT